MHTSVCMVVCVHMYMNSMCVYVCACTCVCIALCAHVCLQVCLCMYSHTCKCTYNHQKISAVSAGLSFPYFSVSVEFLYPWNEEPPVRLLAPRAYSSVPADLEGSSGEQL